MIPTFWKNAIDAAHLHSSEESCELLAMLGQDCKRRPRRYLWSIADRMARREGRLRAEARIGAMTKVLGIVAPLMKLHASRISRGRPYEEWAPDLCGFFCRRIEHTPFDAVEPPVFRLRPEDFAEALREAEAAA